MSKPRTSVRMSILRLVVAVLGVAVLAGALNVANAARVGNVSLLPPISITSDAGFASCGCATLVNGTWVIGPAAIAASSGDGVSIANVTVPFRLQNLTVNGNEAGVGIRLSNVNLVSPTTVVAGAQTSIQKNSIGIVVTGSSNLILDGGGANPSSYGILTNGAAGTINQNFLGAIDVENSTAITVRGWQLSANGQDGNPDWVSLAPGLANWGVGGVRFFGVTNSVVDHNASNNCTSISYSLFNSSGNEVTWNTADYPFTMNVLVTDGSFNNLIDHNEMSTGDFMGVVVADPLPGQPTLALYGRTYGNTISNNIIHSDGPTGNEVHAGIVPDFLGGLVILNGTADNTIINNQLWSDTGYDLKWVQETPNPSTPIGVNTYPSSLAVCNVTVGPNPVAFNGNRWAGNTFKTEDLCGSVPLQH